MNNKASIKKKRKSKQKRKSTNKYTKKTKKKIGGDFLGNTGNWIRKKVNPTKFEKVIEEINDCVSSLLKNKQEFIKYKKKIDEDITKKNNILNNILKALINNIHERKDEITHFKNLRKLFDNIYHSDDTEIHRYDYSYTSSKLSLRSRSKKNISKYNRNLLFYKIGIMRKYEYFMNAKLSKLTLLIDKKKKYKKKWGKK